MIKIYDREGKSEEEIVNLFNEKVKTFIHSSDKVEMKLATTTYVVTTNYNIIE